MKDENNGAIITEFSLERKRFTCTRKEGHEKDKGCQEQRCGKIIMFENYTRCLNDAIEMSCIRSKLHEVYTTSETKITLSPHNDKNLSYIMSDSSDTLPWEHYRCK